MALRLPARATARAWPLQIEEIQCVNLILALESVLVNEVRQRMAESIASLMSAGRVHSIFEAIDPSGFLHLTRYLVKSDINSNRQLGQGRETRRVWDVPAAFLPLPASSCTIPVVVLDGELAVP